MRHDGDEGTWSVQALRLLHFGVYGTAARYGLVSLSGDLRARVDDEERP